MDKTTATRIMDNGKASDKTDGKNDNEPRKDTDEDKEQGQNKKTGEEETKKEKEREVRVRGDRLYEITIRTLLGKMKIMKGLRVNKLDTVRGAEYFRVLHIRQGATTTHYARECRFGAEEEDEEEDEAEGKEDEEEAEGAKKRPFEEVSGGDGGPSGGGVAGGGDGAKRSAKRSSGDAEGSSRGADGSSGGGKKRQSPGVVEDISEVSEMEEGEPDVGEGPMGAMVFGCSNAAVFKV
ncbi:hypothetical protein NQZ68_015139 [Dissostichus eleginoides]|nr:hypothetical protein NQZ68_015139 [Dissostichus eleginoides]